MYPSFRISFQEFVYSKPVLTAKESLASESLLKNLLQPRNGGTVVAPTSQKVNRFFH
jgi:hypothetical protein